jgi:lipase chaperone LimK
VRGGLALVGLAAVTIVVAGALALRDLPELPAPPPTPAERGDAAAAAPSASPSATTGARDASGAADPGDGAAAALPPGPASLRDTRVDGGLAVDASGRFVATPDARRLFDYFLAASGEEPDDVLVARIRAEIARRLPPDAAAEAGLLLDRYLAYRARARTLAEHGLDDAPLDERLATLRALRQATLGAEAADAFFAAEEEADEVAIARLRAAQDPDASPDERAAALAAAEASLPPLEQQRRREARVALELRAAEQEVLAAGGTPDDLRALRERSVGAEAAERLAALDADRAAWRARVDAYRQEKARIEHDPALDGAARDAAVARLRAERFAANERLRIEALDELGPRIEGLDQIGRP